MTPWKSCRRKKAEYGFEFGGTSYYALPFLYALAVVACSTSTTTFWLIIPDQSRA